MTQINPFIGAAVNSTAVQRAQSTEKSGHVQRTQNRAKDSASTGETFEHQVESADAVVSIHDQDPQHPQHRKPKHPPKPSAAAQSDAGEDDGPAHIDVKV